VQALPPEGGPRDFPIDRGECTPDARQTASVIVQHAVENRVDEPAELTAAPISVTAGVVAMKFRSLEIVSLSSSGTLPSTSGSAQSLATSRSASGTGSSSMS